MCKEQKPEQQEEQYEWNTGVCGGWRDREGKGVLNVGG